jgi:hypothetical protein
MFGAYASAIESNRHNFCLRDEEKDRIFVCRELFRSLSCVEVLSFVRANRWIDFD